MSLSTCFNYLKQENYLKCIVSKIKKFIKTYSSGLKLVETNLNFQTHQN